MQNVQKICLQIPKNAKNPYTVRVFQIMVPARGLEPPLPCKKRILSPSRLPFRHAGIFFLSQDLLYITHKIKARVFFKFLRNGCRANNRFVIVLTQ